MLCALLSHLEFHKAARCRTCLTQAMWPEQMVSIIPQTRAKLGSDSGVRIRSVSLVY